MTFDSGPPEDAPKLERLAVSQRLIQLIEQQYPGTLIQVGDDYDWITANGDIVRLSSSRT